jgi:hypothetical protein
VDFDYRQEEFRILMSGLVPTVSRKRLTDGLRCGRKIDRTYWDPIGVTDGPYLGEIPWRPNGSIDPWTSAPHVPEDIKFSRPLLDYHWESHLDCSLPEGASCCIPSQRLIEGIGLISSRNERGAFTDASGSEVFISSQGEGAYLALIKAEPFEQFLVRHELSLFWTFIAERNTWRGGDHSSRLRGGPRPFAGKLRAGTKAHRGRKITGRD